MRKLLSLFVAALFSVTMFAADSYTAAGSSAVLFGKTWDAAVVANDLSLVEGTTYQLVKEGVELPAVTIQFKICEDHKWDKAYPASNYDLDIVESGIYDVTITFDASKGNEGVSAVAEKKGEAVVVPSVAIKGSWDAKGAYDATWNGGAAYDFKIAEDKKTASYACTLTSLTDYNFGLEIGGAWRSNGAITIDREHSSVNFVAGSDNAKLTVDAAGEYTFTWTYETETLSVTFPEKGEDPEPEKVLPVVALAGTMNGWNVTANVLTPAKDSLSASVVVELEAGKDTLKIISDGKWLGKSNKEGLYSMHREWNHVDHFDLINSAEGNVELVADVAGEYTFTWTYADSTLVVTFPAAPFVPEPEYFLVGSVKGWDAVEANKFAATETEGEFKLTATLALDEEIKVLGIAGEDTTWYPDGMDNAFKVTEKFTGEHDIYFRPAGNDDWKSFHEGGFFWMGANPDPEPELVELNLVPGPWVDGSNAKIAAWIWGEKLAGEWTEFIGLEGDTLKFNVKETADSLIFVRFADTTKAPAWYDNGQIWNRLPNTKIDYVGKTYTITAYDKGQWEPFIIATEVLKLVPGKWAEGGAKMNAWVWGENLNGDWAGFFEGTGDTLSVEISSLADSIVFVRFNDTVSIPKWDGGEGYIWNSLAGDTIDHVGLTYTITDWWSGQWEVYVPAPETKELKFVPGVWTTDDAVLAAWVWGGGVEGAWYAFAGEGDTLSTTIPGVAEKAIFVRFNDTVTVFDWNDDITWGKTDEEEIEDCGIFFVNTWDNYSWCEAVEPVVPSEEDGFFLIGTLTSWKPLAEFKFEPNPGQEGEYQLETTLKEGDEFKIAEQKNKAIADEDWYLSVNHVVSSAEAGEVTIYFRPAADGGEGWIEGLIYIHKAATGVEETAVEGKAVKALRDGQLVIIKNGVRYNVIGIRF